MLKTTFIQILSWSHHYWKFEHHNDNLLKIIASYPKYRLPQTIHWKYIFNLLVDSGELPRKWETWEKRIMLIPFQIELKLWGQWFKFKSDNWKGKWTQREQLYSIILLLLKHCPLFTTNMLLFPHIIRPLSNIEFICKKHYIYCLKIELGFGSSQSNPIGTATMLSKDEIIDKRKVWRGNWKPWIEGQTIQWPKEKVQTITYKTTQKTKECTTRTPLKPRDGLRCSGRVGRYCSTSGTVTLILLQTW